MRTPEQILRSLVADIEAMRFGGNAFGPLYGIQRTDGRCIVDWPNLAILAREAREVLKHRDKVGACVTCGKLAELMSSGNCPACELNKSTKKGGE